MNYFKLSIQQFGGNKQLLKKMEASQQSLGQTGEVLQTREKIESETTTVDRFEKVYDLVSQHSHKIIIGGIVLVVAVGFISALKHFI